jgi:outer membrane protein
MDYILSLMPEYKEIEAEISSYQKQLETQLNSKYQEFQDKLNDYQEKAKAGNIAPEVMKDKEKELTDLRASIQKFQSDADTSVQKKSASLLQPAYDKIMKTIHDVAVEEGFSHVFSDAAGSLPIILYGEEEYNLNDDVLKKLGIQIPAKATK